MSNAFDWSPYAVGGATRPDSFTGMDPAFNAALQRLFMAAPPELGLQVGSGYRSIERQRELWEASDKTGRTVARPGRSQHNHGRAADLSAAGRRLDKASPEAREWVHANAENFGLTFPMSWEPWHIELAGARGGDATGHSHEQQLDMGSTRTMAYPSSRVGGLGGLGGMTVPEEEPAQGGLAGFFNEPGVGDVFRAMGMSMMSAPRNNPLALVPEILPGLQAQREKSEERKADRASMAAALQGLGMSPEEAQAYSRNPQAAELILARRREDEARERQRQFAETLYSPSGGASYSETLTDAGNSPADLAPVGADPTSISGVSSAGYPMETGTPAGSRSDVGSSTNKTHAWGQGLYDEVDRIRRAGAMASSAEERAAVTYALDGVNEQIRRYEAWAEKQNAAPDIETIVTDDGRGEQKGYFRNGQFVPIGGVKPIGGASGDITATDRKAIFAAEDDAVVLDSTIDSLSRALELNDKAYEGWTAGVRGDVGYNLGGAGEYIGFDQDAAKATREYQNIMTGEAAAAMSATLKGATTDRELGIFMGIIGDLNTAPETRKRTIEKLLNLAQRKRDTLQRRADELRGGTYYAPGGGSSGDRPSAPSAGSSGRTSSGLSWSVN